MGNIDAFDELTYVTNSQMGFFYKKDQLSTYRKQKRPERPNSVIIQQNLVTSDFTKNNITVLPSTSTMYTGSRNVVLHNGEVKEVMSVSKNNYTLKGGAQVAVEDTFDITLATGVLGHSDATPHRIVKGNRYYAAFTEQLEEMFFEFETGNEFLSVNIAGATGKVEYKIYDSSMNEIKRGWNNSQSDFEIRYKGIGPARYYLCLVGSYQNALSPFSITLSSDNNEWMWQMVYANADTEMSAKFDYYGDEDFFVLPPKVTGAINKSVVRVAKATGNINIVIYDKERNPIGQYVASQGQSISMYGLANAYAMAVYSYEGESIGTEYAFVLEYTDVMILDIETYGFQLSPKFTENIDYYTATVNSIEDKKITDVMYSPKEASASITVTQQCGVKKTAKLGENLPLSIGRNTVELTVKIADVTRTITIVISDKSYNISTARTNTKTEGIAKNTKVLVLGKTDDGRVYVQPCEGDKQGKIIPISDSYIFSGYQQTQIPNTYAEKINELQAKHPNWKFTFVKTGWSFENYVSSQVGSSSIIDNTGVLATREQVEYSVNPLNFLDEQNIFMFEKQTYTEGAYSLEGVKSIWNDDIYASYIMDAATSTGMSPYFIAARAALESGYGTSKLATGAVPGYAGYYNLFGIGAKDSNPLIGGAETAKKYNWNSKRKALIEGAAWIKQDYVGIQQYTPYFIKFCFIPGLEWHQYMTDINAPKKDAQNQYKAHLNGGTINNTIEFVIPVFD